MAPIGGERHAQRKAATGHASPHRQRVGIVHGHGALVAIGDPQFQAIRAQGDAFGALARRSLQQELARHQIDAADRAASQLADVGMATIRADRQHVADAVADIDGAGHLAFVHVHQQQAGAALGGDHHAPGVQETDAVRRAVGAQIDGAGRAACVQVQHRQRAAGYFAAVVADHRGAAVRRDRDFMRRIAGAVFPALATVLRGQPPDAVGGLVADQQIRAPSGQRRAQRQPQQQTSLFPVPRKHPFLNPLLVSGATSRHRRPHSVRASRSARAISLRR